MRLENEASQFVPLSVLVKEITPSFAVNVVSVADWLSVGTGTSQTLNASAALERFASITVPFKTTLLAAKPLGNSVAATTGPELSCLITRVLVDVFSALSVTVIVRFTSDIRVKLSKFQENSVCLFVTGLASPSLYSTDVIPKLSVAIPESLNV